PSAFGPRFADLLRQRRLRDLQAEMRGYRRTRGAGARSLVQATARPFLPHGVRRRVRSRLTRAGATPSGRLMHRDLRALPPTPAYAGYRFDDQLRRVLQRDLTGWGLPLLLRHEDRNSMDHSIEARVPFLDHRLVELAFSLDGGELIRLGETKS